MNKWIVDECGKLVFLIFDEENLSRSSSGRFFKYVDEDLIYALEGDLEGDGWFVSGEFTPHNSPWTGR